MSNPSQKRVKGIQRIIENRAFYSRLMTLWAFVSIIMFGYFSLVLAHNIIPSKRALLADMQRINTALDKNSTTLAILDHNLDKFANDLKIISEYVPASYDTEGFLFDVSYASARIGYTVTRFTPIENEGGYYVKVRFSGKGSPAKLVETLESMPRLVSINKISYAVGKNEDILSMEIQLYKVSVKEN